jgi:hypothetical protein
VLLPVPVLVTADRASFVHLHTTTRQDRHELENTDWYWGLGT